MKMNMEFYYFIAEIIPLSATITQTCLLSIPSAFNRFHFVVLKYLLSDLKYSFVSVLKAIAFSLSISQWRVPGIYGNNKDNTKCASTYIETCFLSKYGRNVHSYFVFSQTLIQYYFLRSIISFLKIMRVKIIKTCIPKKKKLWIQWWPYLWSTYMYIWAILVQIWTC